MKEAKEGQRGAATEGAGKMPPPLFDNLTTTAALKPVVGECSAGPPTKIVPASEASFLLRCDGCRAYSEDPNLGTDSRD